MEQEQLRRQSTSDNRILIGVIAETETTIGFLLAGIGETHEHSRNFMIVSEETSQQDIQSFFLELYNRKNVGVILIASDILLSLSQTIARNSRALPIILEIPSKNQVTESKK